jgi:hypothetical protein
MIEAIEFNTTNKFVSNYEGTTPLVRTGTIKSSLLKSFCNALLLSCSKKFILENDEEKIRSIDKLETDFRLMHQENNILHKFYSDLTEKMHSILNEFYNFLENNQYKFEEKNQHVVKLIHALFDDDNFNEDDDAKTKVDIFIIIKSILTVSVLKKITKLKEHRSFDSLESIKTLILKDIKQFLKYQDIIDEENEKSRLIKLNTVLLVDKIFDVATACLDVPNFESDKVDDFYIEIASNHFQCNLFLIDSKTENIKITKEYNPKLKSILLLTFNDNCYEVVGKLRQSNIINRQFFPYEDIIQSILFQLSRNN